MAASVTNSPGTNIVSISQSTFGYLQINFARLQNTGQSTSIDCAEFDAPETNRFATDSDVSLGEKILDEWFGTPTMV